MHSWCHHVSYYRDWISVQVLVFACNKKHQKSSTLEDLFSLSYFQGLKHILDLMFQFA